MDQSSYSSASYSTASYSTASYSSASHHQGVEEVEEMDDMDEEINTDDFRYETPDTFDPSDPSDPSDPLSTIDSSTEMSLEELQEHQEATQLELLMYESEHILEHGVQPSYEWYEVRFFKIYQYSELNWNDFAHRYQLNNAYLSEKASTIAKALHELIEEWSASPVFDLEIYYSVLHDMNELWKYYESEYMDENQDTDVSDLISGMKHL